LPGLFSKSFSYPSLHKDVLMHSLALLDAASCQLIKWNIDLQRSDSHSTKFCHLKYTNEGKKKRKEKKRKEKSTQLIPPTQNQLNKMDTVQNL
jgi:hypothetical protein